jgi:hypothetical protein
LGRCFGTLATLLGALGTYLLRHRSRYLAPLPPILANTLIIPAVICAIAGDFSLPAYLFYALTVFIGEFFSCGVLGLLLYRPCEKYADVLFKSR